MPKDYEKSLYFFQNILNLENRGHEIVLEQRTGTDFFGIKNSQIEILTSTHEDSPIAKFKEKKGSGIHHIALEVDDIEEWLRYLNEKKIRVINEKPRFGAHHTKVAFIHPDATGGILVELVECLET